MFFFFFCVEGWGGGGCSGFEYGLPGPYQTFRLKVPYDDFLAKVLHKVIRIFGVEVGLI